VAQEARKERARIHGWNRHGVRAIAITACALISISACSSGSDTGKGAEETPSTSAPASQQTKPADPTETAKTDAVDAYKQYWHEMERLYADSSGKGANLKQYAASAALKSAEADAKRTHDRKRIHTGEVTVGNPTVTKLDINRKIPNATISSCLDISQWQVVDSSTKKPVTLPPKRLTKYVIVTTVERWPEGWRVIRDEPQAKAC
jgi:hypothetical protein